MKQFGIGQQKQGGYSSCDWIVWSSSILQWVLHSQLLFISPNYCIRVGKYASNHLTGICLMELCSYVMRKIWGGGHAWYHSDDHLCDNLDISLIQYTLFSLQLALISLIRWKWRTSRFRRQHGAWQNSKVFKQIVMTYYVLPFPWCIRCCRDCVLFVDSSPSVLGYLRSVEVIDHTSFTYTGCMSPELWVGGPWVQVTSARRCSSSWSGGMSSPCQGLPLWSVPAPRRYGACQWHLLDSRSHVFTKSVTDDIQHCSSRTVHPSSLTYDVAKCTQEDLPFKFNTLNVGVFAPGSQYGSISLTHFSGAGIASQSPRRPSLMPWLIRRCPQDESEFSNEKSYCARLDYSSSADIHSWEVNSTIMWDLELHIAVSILSAIIDLNIVTNHGVHSHCCRLLMPGTLRLMPEWVLTRRWCLKRRGSLWISQRRGCAGEWMDNHSTYIFWSESINTQCVCQYESWHIMHQLHGQFCWLQFVKNVHCNSLLAEWIIFSIDLKTSGGPICSWTSSALLSVVREVDWTAGVACGAGAQGGAAGSKRTVRLLLDPTSFTATTTITSKYVFIICRGIHTSW